MVSGEAEALCLGAFATAQGKVYFSEASARRGRVFVGVCPSSFWGWWIVFSIESNKIFNWLLTVWLKECLAAVIFCGCKGDSWLCRPI
jgi:hypothetical protein